MKETNFPPQTSDIIEYVLRNCAIDGLVKNKGENWATIVDDELIFLINFQENTQAHCVSVDNKKCFNKESQCPVHFTIDDLSSRKEKRLSQALKFLRTKEGERASATFQWTGWDEFDSHVRESFYKA